MSDETDDPKAGWDKFIDGLRAAVDRVDTLTADLDPIERADGFRVLVHSLGVQLEGLEMDRARPVPIRHNTWQTKFLLDNPDGRYWTFEVDPGYVYRLFGNVGEAAYTAVTVYEQRERWHDTAVSASLHDGAMQIEDDGSFELQLGGERPPDGNWLDLAADARTVWVRQFYNDVYAERPSHIAIENLSDPGPPAIVDAKLLGERLALGGKKLRSTTSAMRHAHEHEMSQGNHARVWSEMHDGAVFTSSDIWYQRGAWDLKPDQGLLVEGQSVPAKFWNIVLYSRFLNSLEHRYRPISLTGPKVRAESDGRFRILISSKRPEARAGNLNWLDSEGRTRGMFVLRWVFPDGEPILPKVRVVDLEALNTVPSGDAVPSRP